MNWIMLTTTRCLVAALLLLTTQTDIGSHNGNITCIDFQYGTTSYVGLKPSSCVVGLNVSLFIVVLNTTDDKSMQILTTISMRSFRKFAAISYFFLQSCLWTWRHWKQRQKNQQEARAELLISYTKDWKSRNRRVTGPIRMSERHQRWAEKKEQNLPPKHGTKWKEKWERKKNGNNKNRLPDNSTPSLPSIHEDPLLEEEEVPEAAADGTPHPRGRLEITPDMVRCRSYSWLMAMTMRASLWVRWRAQMPAEAEVLVITEPLVSPLRRRMSVSELVVTKKKKGRRGSTFPATGQLGKGRNQSLVVSLFHRL